LKRYDSNFFKQERVLVLEAWKEQEEKIGDEEKIQAVRNKMPRRVKKQKRIIPAEGEPEAPEEEGSKEITFRHYD